MARHVRNVVCPKCREQGRDRSGNNLGEYDDGSTYCYRCGFYSSHSLGHRLHPIPKQETQSTACLPGDVSSYLPMVARVWLAPYELTEYELVGNRLLWSEHWQQLIFPYFDQYNNLAAWQGRSFHPDQQRKHKWYSQGNLQNLYHIISPTSLETYASIVIVEDIVSAIKVGRLSPTLPIFGTNISSRLPGLKHIVHKIILWLDNDMKHKMLKEKQHAESLGFQVRTVFSGKDPKYYSGEEIKTYLDI